MRMRVVSLALCKLYGRRKELWQHDLNTNSRIPLSFQLTRKWLMYRNVKLYMYVRI